MPKQRIENNTVLEGFWRSDVLVGNYALISPRGHFFFASKEEEVTRGTAIKYEVLQRAMKEGGEEVSLLISSHKQPKCITGTGAEIRFGDRSTRLDEYMEGKRVELPT